MNPLLFVPYLRPMVWGGRRFGNVLGKPLPTDESYGESWEVSDHKLHFSVVAHGPLAGQTIHDLMRTQRSELLGSATLDTFPWLVKFLDCNDWLSVQVHPDEQAVKRLLPGEGSKTEAWFILDVAPGGRVWAGLKPGVDESKLRAALDAGTVTECLHSFEPSPGDCVFLPAGTVHAVGGGVLMAELQQTSDATFRLFDWNRKDASGKSRVLHLAESFASILWDYGPVTPVRAEGFGELLAGRMTGQRSQMLVECPYFRLKYVQADKSFRLGGIGLLQTVVVLAGQGRWTDGEALATGQTWVLPASMPRTECRPEGPLALMLATQA